jgi:hypothetical protein
MSISQPFPPTVYECVPRHCEAAATRERVTRESAWTLEYATHATTPCSAWAYRLARAALVRATLDPADYVIVATRITGRLTERGTPIYVYDWTETHDPQGWV